MSEAMLVPRYLTSINHITNAISASCIAVMIVLINADVISRFLLDAPVRGVVEIVALLVPAVVFLSVASLSATNQLIRAELISDLLRKRMPTLGDGLNATFLVVGIVLAAMIAYAVFPEMVRAFRDGEYRGVEGEFVVFVWPLKFVILLGALMLTLTNMHLLQRMLSAQGGYQTLIGTATLIAIAILIALSSSLLENRMSIGISAIVAMFTLVYIGIPVAYALMGPAVVGIGLIKQDFGIAVDAVGLIASGAVSSYVFAAVPLFVFMGLLVGAADIGRDALQAAHWGLKKIRGGLGIATVLANAVFAAITGISIASAAIFSRVAVPPMVDQGFTPRFAVGLVAGSSVLGMLIPPSLLLIIYGLVAEVSINALFTAAIVPGLLLSAAYIAYVVLVATLRPGSSIAPHFGERSIEAIDRRQAAAKALPIMVLLVVILGGIYGGVFTPTEAGAVGALAAMLIALSMRRLSLGATATLLRQAAESSASILFLILAASTFAIMLTLSGIPAELGRAISEAGFGITGYTLAYIAVLILLGMVLDSTSILLVMVPLALPTIVALDGNMIWFGIVTVIGVEIGLLTPPLGISVYTIKSSLDDQSITLSEIFRGTAPFIFIMLALTIVLVYFPVLSLMLL